MAKYRTPLPAHAVAEIKDDPSQAAFWENWQAMGDAKADLADAVRAVTEAETAFIDCREQSGMRTTPGPVCGCGKHYDLIAKARTAVPKAAVPVEKAITKFKKGK